MPIDLAKAIGGGGGGVPIGGVTYLHPGSPNLVESSGQTYLRSGFLSSGDSALYPEAYTALTPFYQGWRSGSTGENISFMAAKNGVIVACNSSASAGTTFLWRSVDNGTTWVKQNYTFPTSAHHNIVSLSWDDTLGMFILVSYYYSSIYYAYIATSVDGVAWTTRGTFTYFEPKNTTKIGGAYYIAAYYPSSIGILRSTDGTTWTQYNLSVTGGLVGGAGKVILVGGNYICTNGSAGSWGSSTDGTTWASFASPIDSHVGSATNTDNTTAVCATATKLYRSTNGTTWTSVRAGLVDVVNVIHANGKFFAITSTTTGLLWVSHDDGLTWSSVSLSARDVLWDGTVWVARTATAVYQSRDCQSWTECELLTGVSINCAVARNGLLVVAGSLGAYATARGDNLGMPVEIQQGGLTAYMRIK